jgi:hypothetical protein
MTDRTPCSRSSRQSSRLLARAKADLIRWTMANADTLKVAAAVVRHPITQAVYAAFPGAEITAIREPQ